MSGLFDDAPRRGFRFPAGLQAELHDSSGSFLCAAENLSRTGVLLVGALPPPSHGQVDITLKDRSGSHSAHLCGRVIRTTTDDDSSILRIAVEFIDVDEADRNALEILLARLLETGASAGPFDALRPGASPPEVKKALDAIPLPQRLSLATRAPLREREFLRADTNSSVLDALVRNPNLVLAEARAIASSPFLAAGAIDTLAGDARFGGDEELVLALAAHPRASLPTAERLTSPLKPPQLRRLLAKPGLRPALRERLLKKLTRS